MTERLYYRDSSLLEFDATIVGRGGHEGKSYTVLDRSAFYPTSGGQLHDTGTLNGVAVVDVIEKGSGEVWHLSHEPVGRSGDTVRGSVDKKRRQEHRQMHTAQHILSQAFIRLYGYQTVSVHLGRKYAAVELDTKKLTSEEIYSAEKMAQEIIEANLPIEILFVKEDEADRLPLRKVPTRTGPLRVIRIGDFDWSACGGTHCNNSAEVGMLKTIGGERIRGHWLVKFLVGRQAYDDYHDRFKVTNQLSQQFTCHFNDLVEKVNKLTTEQNNMRKELARLHKELLPVWAERLAAQAQPYGDSHLVCQEMDICNDRSAGQLAELVAARVGGLAMLLVSKRLYLAVSSESGLDAGGLARRFCEATGLKGGGSSTLAQIGGAAKERMDHYTQVLGKLLSDG